MVQLKTPIRFSDRLSAFNVSPPRQVGDTGKQQLSLTIGDVNPVGIGRPAMGKMLRCNNQGGQLIQHPDFPQNKETVVETWLLGQTGYRTITFAQWVYSVSFYTDGMTLETLYWIKESVGIPWDQWFGDGTHHINWSGNKIWFALDPAINDVTLTIDGFY